jgi:thiosulfate reductase cytochrome b subunit
MTTRTVVVYKAFERFWHWLQAILIFFLGFTGFEIHGAYTFFGFRDAVRYHNVAAIMLLALIVFAIFWHLTTGEWRQYVPTREHIRAQLNYYLFGIFRNAPHPTRKTVLSKLNPLQKLTYFGLKILVIPLIVSSGLLYMLYRYPQQYGVAALNIESLEVIAIAHTAAAFLLVTFFVAHLYLITTGDTVTSNLRAMLTGREDLVDQGEAREPLIHTQASETQV